jgi:hypothetical protein
MDCIPLHSFVPRTFPYGVGLNKNLLLLRFASRQDRQNRFDLAIAHAVHKIIQIDNGIAVRYDHF